MAFNVTQIWQHNPSGELYLVAVNDEGDVREACGPVTQEDAYYTVDEAGGFFNGEAETTEWVIEQAESFRVK